MSIKMKIFKYSQDDFPTLFAMLSLKRIRVPKQQYLNYSCGLDVGALCFSYRKTAILWPHAGAAGKTILKQWAFFAVAKYHNIYLPGKPVLYAGK